MPFARITWVIMKRPSIERTIMSKHRQKRENPIIDAITLIVSLPFFAIMSIFD